MANFKMASVQRERRPEKVITVLALLVLAANLRPALTSVGPILQRMQVDTGISLATAGLLNSLPLAALGLFAPFGQIWVRFGIARTLAVCLLLVAVGIAIRSSGSTVALFFGSAVLAIDIAIGNVLAPVVVKREFPGRVKSATAGYVVVLGLTAALASALSSPLADVMQGGWRSALAVWATPALAGAVVWMSLSRRMYAKQVVELELPLAPIWRSRMAWFVSAFMGLQSLNFYVVITWFPSMLADQGLSASECGLLVTIHQIAGMVGSALIPWLPARNDDQRMIASTAPLLVMSSTLGLLCYPDLVYIWMVLLGFGGGACLTMALSFMSLRAGDHRQAASLSMMSQCIGYLIAALGPVGFGLARDVSQGWTWPMLSLAGGALAQAAAGWAAGKNRA